MKQNSRTFRVLDLLLLAGIILPLLAGMVIKVLFVSAGEGISISGAYVFFTIPLPLGGLPITESQVNSFLVILSLFFACLYLTHGLSERAVLRRQHVAEWIVQTTENMVQGNMGTYFSAYGPFVAGIMALSACSSLLTLIGLFPPTSDLNVVAGWSLLVFILITYYKCKCGPLHYLRSYTEPVPLLTPLNVISEVATPVSMAFRHYGNVLSGSVISVLVATGLGYLSSLLLGWLSGILASFPLLQIGIPAVLSLYFDLFSGLLQAFIFAMLTMLYIDSAFPEEDYRARRERRRQKKLQKASSHI